MIEGGNTDALNGESERTQLATIEGWDDVVFLDTDGKKVCGVHRDGRVSCLGYERNGPESRPGQTDDGYLEGVDDAIGVEVMSGGVCVLEKDGSVRCAGRIAGSGETRKKAGPMGVREVPGLENIVQLGSGGSFVCALDSGGVVRCWGRLQRHDEFVAAPRAVDLPRPMQAIAAGERHVCALADDGRVACWGNGFDGQLGDGSALSRTKPVFVHALADAVEISAGYESSCARRADSSLVCWGRDEHGQLGTRNEPVTHYLTTVEGVDHAIQVEAAEVHACALGGDGQVSCWGMNRDGQLGAEPGRPFARRTAQRIVGLTEVVDISLGPRMSCARRRDGSVYCWGQWLGGDYSFPTGIESGERSAAPVRIERVQNARSISAGGSYACALEAGGAVMCWGANLQGQVTGTPGPLVRTPVPVPGLDDAIAVAAQSNTGDGTTWAVRRDGKVQAWGAAALPSTEISALRGSPSADPSCADDQCCAATGSGRIACWDNSGSAVPHPKLRNVLTVRCAGYGDCCALTSDSIRCWGGPGLDSREALRRTLDGSDGEPVSLPAKDPVALGVGRDYVCWGERAGPVRCWGLTNSHGQLGAVADDIDPTLVPVADPVTIDFEAARVKFRQGLGR